MRRPWFKWPEKVTSVYESWRPLFYLCDYFLFVQFPTSSRDRVSSFSTSGSQIVRLTVGTVVLIVAIITNTLDSMTHFHMLSPSYSPVEAIAGRLVVSLGSTAAISLWIMSKVLQGRYGNFVRNINSIDTRMMTLNYPVDPNLEFREFVIHISVILVIFHILICITHPVLEYYNFWIMAFWAYLIYIENGPIMTNNHACIIFVRAVRNRFIAMNKYIRTNLLEVRDNQEVRSELELVKALINVSRFHSELIDRVTDINYCFGFQLLVMFTSLFFYGIFTGFAIYRTISYFGSPWTVYTYNNILWSCLHLGTITYFIKISSNLTTESEETGVLIHRVANTLEKPTEDVLQRLELLSQQFQHRSAIISCGFFEFNWVLWYTLVGSAVSLVILLIQFESAAATQSNINITRAAVTP